MRNVLQKMWNGVPCRSQILRKVWFTETGHKAGGSKSDHIISVSTKESTGNTKKIARDTKTRKKVSTDKFYAKTGKFRFQFEWAV